MKKNILILTIYIFIANTIRSQETIDVTDQTMKIGGMKEEELYFGFAEGDKIIFNFKEIDKKELKEVEIIEYPSNSKFSDYKTFLIENKTISVNKTGVYHFRFKNGAMGGRICKIQIQRIPANESTKNFNSTVTWENKQETTYNIYTKDVIVGYDTTKIQKKKIELVKTELSEEMFLDKSERVNSQTNLDYANYRTVPVTLPNEEISTYKTKKIVSWAYWIGVGKESDEAWAKNVKMISNAVKGAATVTGAGPLAGIAIGAVSSLMTPTVGEDVAYWFIPNYQNAQLFLAGQPFNQFDMGKGIAAYGKNNNRTKGTFYIGLLNDNTFQGINVKVKVSVIWETNYFEDKEYTEETITPRYEKKEFSDPIIKKVRVPVTGK